jgi:hypothetical protein
MALARLHGGALRIDSVKGKGTRVFIDLPTQQHWERHNSAAGAPQPLHFN